MQEPKIKPQLKLMATYYCGEACGNAEKAAVLAGYSKRYARGNSYKLVARKDFQEYVEYLNSLSKHSLGKRIASIEEIQAFWTEIFTDEGCKVSDRLKASELLAKCKGAFLADNW
jgi:phage terminase small subunit